jgi:hypothetical protein
MRGDFSRKTHDRKKHFSSVRMQQGRVQLDADWNEQVDIQREHDRQTRRDVIGPAGTPVDAEGVAHGFRIQPSASGANLIIGAGSFYVDGVLVQNDAEAVVFAPSGDEPRPLQPFVVAGPEPVPPPQQGVYLAYLHVFERHLTYLEEPLIRELALGGPDHGTRTQTCWQVALLYVDDADLPSGGGEGSGSSSAPALPCSAHIPAWDSLTAAPAATLAARATPGEDADDPCIVPPSAGYRGPENQLYRVEVFQGGAAGAATFVWSRENGSVTAAWLASDDNRLTIARQTTDSVLGFANDDWVELSSDHHELADPNVAEPERMLVQIAVAEGDELLLRTSTSGLGGPGSPSNDAIDRDNFASRPLVRRWDSDGQLTIPADERWVELEDGVEVRFGTGPFVSGQYWLIPARTATRDVEWPKDGATPRARSPEGVEHLYTKLGFVRVRGNGSYEVLTDCRATFVPAALEEDTITLQYLGGDGLLFRPNTVAGELRAGVFMGTRPLEGVRVRFEVVQGADGAVLSDTEAGSVAAPQLDVDTDAEGVARVWLFDTNWVNSSLRVRASMVDAAGRAVPPFIVYRADREAQLVACSGCPGAGLPEQELPGTLQVRAVHLGQHACPGAAIRFRVVGGGRILDTRDPRYGNTTGEMVRNADQNGQVELRWILGSSGAQTVEAQLLDGRANPLGHPVCFRAELRAPLFEYLGGDGQSFSSLETLSATLRTRVSLDGVGVAGVRVRYQVINGEALLADHLAEPGEPVRTTVTDAQGVAKLLARPTANASFTVRAFPESQQNPDFEPHVQFRANHIAGGGPAVDVVRIGRIAFVENNETLATVHGAGTRIQWSDLGASLFIAGEYFRSDLVGVPLVQVFLGWPIAPDNELMLGHTWVRLPGEVTSMDEKAITWQPGKEVHTWIKRGIEKRVLGHATLPARILLRGLFRWDDGRLPAVAKNWAGDLDIELVVELPEADPIPEDVRTDRLEVSNPLLDRLRAGLSLTTAGGRRVALRYDPDRRRYLVRDGNTETPLIWSPRLEAYVARTGNLPLVVPGLPRVGG